VLLLVKSVDVDSWVDVNVLELVELDCPELVSELDVVLVADVGTGPGVVELLVVLVDVDSSGVVDPVELVELD